jgi:hypothetical protein
VIFPKAAQVEDPAYLRWCREQRCAFCHKTGGEAHHVEHKGMGGATLRDDLAVPACRICHRRCHGIPVVADGQRLPPIDVRQQRLRASRARAKFLTSLRPPGDDDIPW